MRILKHLLLGEWYTARRLPAAAMARIEAAIARSEKQHSGEIRVVVEASLPLTYLWRGADAWSRAVEMFSGLRVWDTEENCGVLIYLLLADRDIEIVADRGVARAVPQEQWDGICHEMESLLRDGKFEQGILRGLERITALLSADYPPTAGDKNELPDGVVSV